jgi:hypothetical protein
VRTNQVWPLFLIALLTIFLIPHIATSGYAVVGLNTTVRLYTNTSASVAEVINISISNQSVNQYSMNRAALNLTLSDWQAIVGPTLVEHIINPSASTYNFHFIPGPLEKGMSGSFAYLLLTYNVNNVTIKNDTGPRTISYSFNPKVLNFEHGASGQILPSNTTLTIMIPTGALLKSIYPIPDYPTSTFTNGYKNVTSFSWFNGEPLSKFTLQFVIIQPLSAEVSEFFTQLYGILGIWTYIIIAVIIVLFVLYTYLRTK